MTRPLRLHAPGLLHHVFARGSEKACIFADDRDCESSLELLANTLPRFQCRIVEDCAYARTVLRYLALNPVAAGRTAKPEDWRWSSYRFALGLEGGPDFLSQEHVWAAFGTSDCGVGRARFANFVLAGLQDVFTNPLMHGSTRLASRLAPELEPHQATRDYVYPHRFAARPTLGTLLDGRADRLALDNAVHTAFHHHAYTLAEIASELSCDPSTICRWIKRAAQRQSAGESSPAEDVRARNKI